MKPYLFKVGGFELRIYSLMYILAFLIGIFICLADDVAEKRGVRSRKIVEDFAFTAIVSGLIGARLYYVILRFSDYASNPISIFKVWEGGLAIHGGIIGAFIGACIYAKKSKLNLWVLTDMGVGALMFGQFLGRFGNLANGEVHGVPTFTPLSVIFSMVECISINEFRSTSKIQTIGTVGIGFPIRYSSWCGISKLSFASSDVI